MRRRRRGLDRLDRRGRLDQRARAVHLRRRPLAVGRPPPPRRQLARRGRGHPRRLLEGGVRRLARRAPGRGPRRARLDGLEPGVPPGRQRRRRPGHLRRRRRRHRPPRRRRGPRPRHRAHPGPLRRRAPRRLGGGPRPLRAVGRRAGARDRGGVPGRRARPDRGRRGRSRRRSRRGVPRRAARAVVRRGRPAPAGPARRARCAASTDAATPTSRCRSPRTTCGRLAPPARTPSCSTVDGDHFVLIDPTSDVWDATVDLLDELGGS